MELHRHVSLLGAPRLAAMLVALLVGSGPAHAQSEARVLDRVAAVVDEDVITLSEVADFVGEAMDEQCLPPAVDMCRRQILGEALDTLVRRSLQRQELDRLGEDVTEEEIDRTIQQVVMEYQLPDREALRLEVEAQGIPWDLYRKYQIEDYVREQKFNQLVLRNRVTISDDELRDQYQRLVREQGVAELVRLDGFGIVLPEDPVARLQLVEEVSTALAAARAGQTTFEAVAAANDARKATGFVDQAFARPDLPEELAEAAFAVEAGTITEPVVANGVLWALRVVRREQGTADVAPFEEVKARLADQVFVRKLEQASDAWYASARRRAALRVYIDADGFEKSVPGQRPRREDEDEAEAG